MLNENKPSVWNLVLSRDFIGACLSADEEFLATGNDLPLRNKVYALLHLKRYQEAAELCRKIAVISNGETSSEFKFEAIAEWIQGHHEKALMALKNTDNTKYTDAAGGVEPLLLMFYFSQFSEDKRIRNDILNKLKKISKGKQSANWPGPIAQYLLGEIAEDYLRSKIAVQNILRQKQTCQACFYIAAQNPNRAMDLLQEAMQQGIIASQKTEYYLAKHIIDAGE